MAPDFRDFTPDPRDAVLVRSRTQTLVWYLRVLWRPVGALVVVVAVLLAFQRYGHDLSGLLNHRHHPTKKVR